MQRTNDGVTFVLSQIERQKKKLFIYATLDLAFLVMLYVKLKKIENFLHGRSAVSGDLAVLLRSRLIGLLPV